MRIAFDHILDFEGVWRSLKAADVARGTRKAGKAVMGAFQGEAIGGCRVVADGDVGTVPAAESTEEIGLVCALKAERVVA